MNKNKPVFISCIDHSVSGEKFDLLYDEEYDMLITTPQPDPEKLPKYYETEEYISHTDSKKNAFEKIYQLIKKYSLNKKIKLVNKHTSKKGSMLDIGAGTGDFLLAAKKNGWITQGIEPNENARNLAKGKKIQLVDDINNLNGKKYDVITMWHVLEHIPNLIEHIKTLQNLLSDDGVLIIAVPNYKSYDALYYKEFWAAYDVPRHLWHFSKKSIENLFLKERLKVIKTKALKFDSYYVSLLSEKYKTGQMNPIKAFYIGLKSNLKAKSTGNYSSIIYIIKKLK